MAAAIEIAASGFAVTSRAHRIGTPSMQEWERQIHMTRDNLGPYMVAESDDGDFAALLPMGELHRRLRGHLVGIDHTGVILPTAGVTRTSWDMLLTALAAGSNLYRYPTGEPWPFILPATDTEFTTAITHFTLGRVPKFELVYDSHVRHPLIQFDFETDLTRAEIEARFPEPYGRAIPGLAQFFRSVYLFHPWPRLTIRVDLRYHSDGPPSDWDTGAWLVTAGGRMH
jgi:hypothetical protein